MKKSKLKNYAQFFDDTGISADGGNHPIFVIAVLAFYCLSLWVIFQFQVFFGLAIGLCVFYFTQNPFRYRFWFPMSRHKKIYRYHKKITLGSMDLYIINEFIFSPFGSQKDNIEAKFQLLEKELNNKSA